jgi:GT2 family glycosyltransferase
MMSHLRVSVIIPSYNRLHILPQTLASLARPSPDAACLEVIVVDDGSTDGTLAWLRAHVGDFPFALRLVEQARGGPGAARNRGARAAGHELLLFWDSDMIAEATTLEAHAALHDRHPRALVAGALRPWRPACTSTYDRVIHLDSAHLDQFSGLVPSFQEALTSNLSVRRPEFDQLGGFDEMLQAFEDTDLAYRAQQSGMLLLFSREAIGYHNYSETLAVACQRQRRYQRQAAAFLSKHPELRGKLRYLADKGPIELGRDPARMVVRKAARQLVASRGPLALLEATVRLLERVYPRPGLLRFLYWKVVASYQLIGFREGLREPEAALGQSRAAGRQSGIVEGP